MEKGLLLRVGLHAQAMMSVSNHSHSQDARTKKKKEYVKCSGNCDFVIVQCVVVISLNQKNMITQKYFVESTCVLQIR